MDLNEVKGLLVEMLTGAERGDEAITMVIRLLANLRDQNSRLELDRMRLLRKHLGQTSEKISTNARLATVNREPNASRSPRTANSVPLV